MKLNIFAAPVVGLSLIMTSLAGSIVVSFDSGGSRDLRNAAGVLLSGGNANVDHDGTVLQLGYFSQATSSNLFSGQWVPLTGEGSANVAFNNTTVGDNFLNGPGDGQFQISVAFTDNVPASDNNLPPVGTPLAIRFFDGKTIAQSTRYETVSSSISAWLWKAPATPQPTPIAISFDDAGVRIQSTNAAPTGAQLRTTTPVAAVPEPSVISLLAFAGAFATFRRTRS